MRVFFALIMLQSIVRKPEIVHFWSRRPILSTPFFGDTMSYRRFTKIRQYLHFVDNDTYDPLTNPNPKLNKIWRVHQMLEEKFRELYTPERDITIDESLLLYKGRLGWRQYMPQKRARFGIKTFMLCESKSGYVWSTVIYTGKGTIRGKESEKLSMSTQVVKSLMEPLLDKGYCLTTDNFFTSPELAELLKTRVEEVLEV
ncbi:hypothetical protein J437_LFUL002305 [Ladona fulva]|uniref:PiggyBac transposable element-derived protein domain-containing protein n=1 Tax=Ladona fulva TaxID=123851 RepID=A0A8K0JXG0_LADFU|nr:hypothetical protein J437_LFUL002305 [Ladona fulva]